MSELLEKILSNDNMNAAYKSVRAVTYRNSVVKPFCRRIFYPEEFKALASVISDKCAVSRFYTDCFASSVKYR